MKKQRFGLLLISAFALMLNASCAKEGCTDPQAINYDAEAKKSTNTCTYDSDKFLGSFKLSQGCEWGDNPIGTLQIVSGPSKQEIVIKDWFLLFDITAQVEGNKLSFKRQFELWTYEGTGYLAGNAITIDYTVCLTEFYPCADPTECTMICVR